MGLKCRLSESLPGISEEVGLNSWRIAKESDAPLCTGQITSGVVLAAYNDVSRHGLLGHFFDLRSTGGGNFDDAIKSIPGLAEHKRGRYPHQTLVWLGIGPEADLTPDRAPDRNVAIKRLDSFISAAFLPKRVLGISHLAAEEPRYVQLNCQVGRLSMSTKPPRLAK